MQLKKVLDSTVAAIAGNENPAVVPLYLPDVAAKVKSDFGFVSAPTSLEDFEATNGLKFKYGRGDGFIVNEMTIFNDGISCVGTASTDRVRGFVVSVIKSLRELGSSETESSVRWLYNSRVEVFLSPSFSGWLSRFDPIVQAVRNKIEEYGVPVTDYRSAGFTLGGEGPSALQPGRFALERRTGIPFSENLYYSEAPLSTDEHLEFIEACENIGSS